MTVFIEASVPVAELAKALKTSEAKAVAECRGLGVYVGADWAGRPAVSEVDAQALVSGSARRLAEHDAAWRKFVADSEDWERQRSEIYRRVAVKVAEDAQRRGRGGPSVHADAAGEAAIP